MREAGEERVGSGCFKGRGGENMGKLCNNIQSFVIEKRAGGRKGAGAGNARYSSWQVWTPYPPN